MARAIGSLKINTAEILEHKKQLEQLNRWFEIALNNMARGLSMFDAEQRLIVCNKLYREIYDLPEEYTRAGTPLAEIVRFHARRETGRERSADIHRQRKWIDQHVAELTQGRTFSYVQTLANGRIIQITNQPLSDGGWVDLQEDITDKRQSEQKISWLARHDALTGIANRFHFREQLECALKGLGRDDGLAILWIDLDKFKDVNDTFGHPVGDRVLKGAARRLRKAVGNPHIVGRLGGDEFAVLQRNVKCKSDAEKLAKRLLHAIGAPQRIAGANSRLDASIGIALAPKHGRTVDELLKNVDIALYKAKTSGGNSYAFYAPGKDVRIKKRHQLEADLKWAVQKQELTLYYQPIVNLKAREVTSFEALMRWQHPEQGMIVPDDFIPIAEQSGLIVAMGAWALHQACMDAATWPKPIKVAVNLSSAQFEKGDLIGCTRQALEKSGLPASRLELEVTETVLLRDDPRTHEILHKLRNLGVCIALDDFGTAFASLSYLQSFPFDKIKIDRSFIRDLPQGGNCLAIINAVTSLAKKLNMGTVAEGIETRAHLATVAGAGCDEVQGFYFSRPVPAGEVPDVLTRCRAKCTQTPSRRPRPRAQTQEPRRKRLRRTRHAAGDRKGEAAG